jgi:hypothetical protein
MPFAVTARPGTFSSGREPGTSKAKAIPAILISPFACAGHDDTALVPEERPWQNDIDPIAGVPVVVVRGFSSPQEIVPLARPHGRNHLDGRSV